MEPSPLFLRPSTTTQRAVGKSHFYQKNGPAYFQTSPGVLALKKINILSADIYTWRDATPLEIFNLTEPFGPINPDKVRNDVKRDLRNVFMEKLSLECA